MIHFDEISEFGKDLKRLMKKYRSLHEDLTIIKKILSVEPDAAPPFSFRIEGLKVTSCIIKVRKIACKSLKYKGVNSGLRLVYAYFKEDSRIVFIEIYHKNDKSLEDRERILKHFK
jgi:mRNA-degrading endonuclease RelE of RelBE toxin-antitoxin system